MKTFIICLLALGIQHVNATVNCTALPTICHFEGVKPWHTYEFNLADLKNELKSCCIISYSDYKFDFNKNNVQYMVEKDKDAINLLKENENTIYLRISYDNTSKWPIFLDPKNEKTSNQEIESLVSFLKDKVISGIILQYIYFYGDDAVPLEHIILFANKMKVKMCDLIIGVYVYGQDYENLSKKDLDFVNLNEAIDFYFVDMTLLNTCGQIVQINGMNPTLPVAGRDLISLQDVIGGVQASGINICKVYVILQVPPAEANDVAFYNNEPFLYGCYSQVCNDASLKISIKRWCLDSLTTLYNQAKFVKGKNFYGLNLEAIEGDDTNCDCGCNKFPISQALIKGWNVDELPTECEKIKELDIQNQS